MATEPAIVRVGPALLGEVLEIERLCFHDPWPAPAYEAELGHPWSFFRAIGPGGPGGGLARAQGFIVAWLLPGDMHLLKMAVLPERRRGGLARRLLDAALQRFAAAGGGSVSLEVRPSNPAAQAFYAQMGFVQVGVRRNYYQRDGEDALVLVRKVDLARTGSPASARAGSEG